MSERVATLGNAGPPVTALWAWVVIDAHGREAMCVSPWGGAGVLVSPDRENIAHFRDWCEGHYTPHGMRVEFRRYDLGEVIET